MSWNVSAKHNRYGTFYDYDREVNVTRAGIDGAGNPYNGSYSYQDLSDYQNKTANRDPYKVNGFKMPKGYIRSIAKLLEHRPFVLREKSTSGGPYNVEWGYPFPQRLEPPSIIPGPAIANLVAQLDTMTLNRLRGKETLSLGASLAEAKSTVNMIAGNSIAVLEAYRALRRGNVGLAARKLGLNSKGYGRRDREVASRWLEFQFGWLPLMGDIYDGFGVLENLFREERMIYNASAKAEISYEKDVVSGEYVDHLSSSVFCKTKVFYEVANATTDLIDRAGLGNPLTIAWEIIPFSFVVDWFVPVGNVLSALTATSGLQFVAGYRDEKTSKRLKSEFHMAYRGPGWSQSDTGLYHSESMYFSRFPMSGFPNPQFYANGSPFSTTRVLDAIALIRQLF